MTPLTCLASFKRHSADPDSPDQSGLATFRVGHMACTATMLSIEHAIQLGAFIDGAVRRAKGESRRAAAKFIRGAADNLESSS